MYFWTETDAAKNLIDDFFLTLTVRRPFHRKDFKWKYGKVSEVWDYFLKKKTEALQAELNERAEAVTNIYSPEVDFSQYIYLVVLAENH